MRILAAASVSALSVVVLAAACDGRDAPTTTNGPGSSGDGGEQNFVAAISSGPSSGAGANENVIPDPAAPCDAGLGIASTDPFEAAAAVGLCTRVETEDDFGVIDARWAMADGSDAIFHLNYEVGHGILDGFGDEVVVQEGSALLALSSGTARQPSDSGFQNPGGFDKGYTSPTPAGYPKESPACQGVTTGATHDDIALEVTLRAPPLAEALSFDFNFYTYEWPEFVCSEFNDFFLAFMDPFPSSQPDGNISFDSEDNVVSVNNALVQVCDCSSKPCGAPTATPILFYDCDKDGDELMGTGFEGAAATSWLVTKAPVEPGGDVSLRWTVYDSGDGVLDSTVLIDNFRWLGEVETDPVTEPK